MYSIQTETVLNPYDLDMCKIHLQYIHLPLPEEDFSSQLPSPFWETGGGISQISTSVNGVYDVEDEDDSLIGMKTSYNLSYPVADGFGKMVGMKRLYNMVFGDIARGVREVDSNIEVVRICSQRIHTERILCEEKESRMGRGVLGVEGEVRVDVEPLPVARHVFASSAGPGSRDYGLHYDRHPAVIEGYSDANWISNIKDSRSTSGYVFTLGGAAISWKYSKQTVIAKSTMESKFIALDKCGEEVEWLRQFVEDIPRWPQPVTVISIHCDSKSAMGRAQSTMYNGKSRHIRRRHNSIRQLLSTRFILIDYVASKDNIADPFTKGLSRELVSKSCKGMGLKPLKE
ncbi:hypothetical protein Tco_1254617 [Tanacetum coccineum]